MSAARAAEAISRVVEFFMDSPSEVMPSVIEELRHGGFNDIADALAKREGVEQT